MSPLVSILIPVYNSSHTIRDTIISCLKQTFTDFEIVVYNAGSADHSAEIIHTIKDPRIVYIESPVNKGIAASRNELLKAAKGEFIAWLDADDIMKPERLEKQLEYFRSHPEVDILGSWISTDYMVIPNKKLPLHHHQIRHCLWFKNCMIQPSVMSRNFYVNEGHFYDENFANSVEDYELWYRLRDLKTFANIDQELTHYHMTIGEELQRKQELNKFENNLLALWDIKWKAYPLILSDKQKNTFIRFLYENSTPDSEDIKHLLDLFKQLEKLENDDFFKLLLAYHRLRLWRNMGMTFRLINIGLLGNLRHWPALRSNYLI